MRRSGVQPAVLGVGHPAYSPEEKDNPRVIFVRRDQRYFHFEIRGVRERYVATAEFEHPGEVSEKQRRTPLTIVEAHDR